MLLSTILFKFFTSNAETMLVSVQGKPMPVCNARQRTVPIEDAETMQVRVKLAIYFDSNAETMPVSAQSFEGQTYAALNRARARYTIEGIHRHVFELGSTPNSRESANPFKVEVEFEPE
ncbi:hypothetical protein R3P38DRAFT_3216973 [Favolaschia claudopus]|uniref:Uncharacterized protein n=1 Tax=Favolaschia claudopus TaxID=2862362 RepID=A0AAW0A6D6_9AGAR